MIDFKEFENFKEIYKLKELKISENKNHNSWGKNGFFCDIENKSSE